MVQEMMQLRTHTLKFDEIDDCDVLCHTHPAFHCGHVYVRFKNTFLSSAPYRDKLNLLFIDPAIPYPLSCKMTKERNSKSPLFTGGYEIDESVSTQYCPHFTNAKALIGAYVPAKIANDVFANAFDPKSKIFTVYGNGIMDGNAYYSPEICWLVPHSHNADAQEYYENLPKNVEFFAQFERGEGDNIEVYDIIVMRNSMRLDKYGRQSSFPDAPMESTLNMLQQFKITDLKFIGELCDNEVIYCSAAVYDQYGDCVLDDAKLTREDSEYDGRHTTVTWSNLKPGCICISVITDSDGNMYLEYQCLYGNRLEDCQPTEVHKRCMIRALDEVIEKMRKIHDRCHKAFKADDLRYRNGISDEILEL